MYLWANISIILLWQNTSVADGSIVLDSPSSMVNQYRLEDNDEEQQEPITKDLFVSVDNPESHVTTIETFITYRVVTKVRRSSRTHSVSACNWSKGPLYQTFQSEN